MALVPVSAWYQTELLLESVWFASHQGDTWVSLNHSQKPKNNWPCGRPCWSLGMRGITVSAYIIRAMPRWYLAFAVQKPVFCRSKTLKLWDTNLICIYLWSHIQTVHLKFNTKASNQDIFTGLQARYSELRLAPIPAVTGMIWYRTNIQYRQVCLLTDTPFFLFFNFFLRIYIQFLGFLKWF